MNIGAQPGNKNASKGRPWTDALRKAVLRLAEDGSKRKKLDVIAAGVVNAAVAGDMAAVTEIANRLDGKPIQPVDDASGLTITMNFQRTRALPQEFIDGEHEEVVGSDERHYLEKR